jgi:hypothetical protein
VNQIAAADRHLRVGSTLELGAFPGSGAEHLRLLPEHVVGIMVTRSSIVPITDRDRVPVILTSAALFRELGPGYAANYGAYVKLPVGGNDRQLQPAGPGTRAPLSRDRRPGDRGGRGRAGGSHRAVNSP